MFTTGFMKIYFVHIYLLKLLRLKNAKTNKNSISRKNIIRWRITCVGFLNIDIQKSISWNILAPFFPSLILQRMATIFACLFFYILQLSANFSQQASSRVCKYCPRQNVQFALFSMCLPPWLKGTVSRDFQHFFIQKLHLGPIWTGKNGLDVSA